MDMMLVGLTWLSCLVYLDDIVVFSSTFEQHLERLDAVFQRLKQAKMKLNASKCKLFRLKVHFLDHVISHQGVEPDPAKTEVVRTWRTPQNLTELRAFVGLANYYRRHIKSFAEIAHPLHELTKKGALFRWTERQQHAFEKLKVALTSAPILAMPQDEGRYVVDTDASNDTIGAVIQQEQSGVLRVIAYASRALSVAEKAYCTTRKELLAIVYALKHYRHFLLGTIEPFELRTDHAALTSLLKSPEPVGQQARWLDLIAEYNFKIVHRAGRLHGNSDALSRRPCCTNSSQQECHQCVKKGLTVAEGNLQANVSMSDETALKTSELFEKESPNHTDQRQSFHIIRSITRLSQKDQEVINENDSIVRWSRETEAESAKDDIAEKMLSEESLTSATDLLPEVIRREQNLDPVLQPIIQAMRRGENLLEEKILQFSGETQCIVSQWESLTLINEILYRTFQNGDGTIAYYQLIVPSKLQKEVLKQLHAGSTSGHLSDRKTFERVRRVAYWPGYRRSTRQFVEQCLQCCRYRRWPTARQGKMQGCEVNGPMQRLHCDLTGPHTRSKNGFVYLFTAIDYFTKYLVAVPLRNKTAWSVANALVTKVYLVFGCSETQINDQGREFENEVMENAAKLLDIKRCRTSAYRPQGNGVVERVHSTINGMFAKMISSNQRDWCEKVPYICFAYNTAYHSSTSFTPAYLTFGRNPTLPVQFLMEHPQPDSPIELDEYSETMAERLREAFSLVRKELNCAFERNKRRYDAKVKEVQFSSGDLVWFYCPRTKPGIGRKWQSLTNGPMLVVRKVNAVNYAIKRSPTAKPFIVHIDFDDTG
jgi:hypothetical protein